MELAYQIVDVVGGIHRRKSTRKAPTRRAGSPAELAATQLPVQVEGFADDAERGLHSTNFNLAENIEAEDSRHGLDENARQQVYRIMQKRKVNFDEGRRLWMEQRFRDQGIGPDGRPLDRKAVVFS